MPFVRFSRDRRGFENIYLVDSSRILYWHRSPPGVKIGREPFDESVRRELEAQYPRLTFDWNRIVATRFPPPAPEVDWRERKRASRNRHVDRAEEPDVQAEAETVAATAAGDESPEMEQPAETAELQAVAAVSEAGGVPAAPGAGQGRRRRRRRRGGRGRVNAGPEKSS